MFVDSRVATPTSMDEERYPLRHHQPWDASSVGTEVAIPPATRRMLSHRLLMLRASQRGSSTCYEYRQPTVKLAAGLVPGRASPADQYSSTPSVKLRAACVSAEAQTDMTIAGKGRPVVNFLDSAECPSDDDMPNCFPLGNNLVYARSPRIPVIVEGVRVPMLLDTGAEVTILSSDFLHRLFPGQDLPDQGRSVRSLGGNHLAIKGPVMLTIELCNIVLRHPVYYCDNAQTPLLGYDVMAAIALVIDTGAKCVWSSLTTVCGHSVNFTNSGTSPTAVSSTAADSTAVFNSSITAPPTADSSTTAAEWLSATPSSVFTSTTTDASTTPKKYSRRPPCESSRPLHRRLTSSSSSPNSADLGDSARVTATAIQPPTATTPSHLIRLLLC